MTTYTAAEIRRNLSRRYSSIRRSRAGIWTATDDTVRIIRLRAKRVRIGSDEDARNAAEMLAR